jgi:hypothetical protein
MQLPFIKRAGTDPDALAYFSRAGIASGTQTPSSYDNAASFASASSQSLTSTAANLQCQSQSFTVAGWFFMPSNAPDYSTLFAQGGHPSSANSGFLVQRYIGMNFLYMTLRNDNAGTGIAVNSETFSYNTWNFVECGWDSNLNQSFISINGRTRDFSTPTAGWTFPNTTNSTRIGRSPFGDFYTGNLAGWGLWKRALTASEVTALWNNGAGRTYASLDSGLRNNLISWWALNQNSVTADSHGTNTLTNNGTVTAPNIGPVVTGYGDSRRLISDFVRGIKSLGLWNSMVCWPLRASQNAGGGTTAFSLGGLGQFNGTLVNAPTWGSDGINCATTSQRLTFGPAVNIQSYGGFTIFGTQIHRNLSSSSELSLLTRNDGLWPESTHQAVSQSSTYIRIGTSPSRHVTAGRGGTEQNRFHSYHATVDSNESGFLTYNKTSPVAFGSPATTGVPPTIDWTLNWSCTGVYAMHGVMRSYTQGQQAQLYDLYRQTLGLGLGLP